MPRICKAVFSGSTVDEWQEGYRTGKIRPENLLETVDGSAQDSSWITLLDETRLRPQIAELDELLDRASGDPSRLPLYGVPFAVKDNINVAGWPTTAACPEFAYVAGVGCTLWSASLRSAPAPSSSAKPTLTSLRRVLSARVRPTASSPTPFNPGLHQRGLEFGVRRRWLRAVSCRSRWEPIPRGRVGFLPGSTTSWD